MILKLLRRGRVSGFGSTGLGLVYLVVEGLGFCSGFRFFLKLRFTCFTMIIFSERLRAWGLFCLAFRV